MSLSYTANIINEQYNTLNEDTDSNITDTSNPPLLLIKPLLENSIIRKLLVHQIITGEKELILNRETYLEIKHIKLKSKKIKISQYYQSYLFGVCKDIWLFGEDMLLAISDAGKACFLRIDRGKKGESSDLEMVREIVINSLDSEYQFLNRKLAVEGRKHSFSVAAWLTKFTIYFINSYQNKFEQEPVKWIKNSDIKDFTFEVQGVIWAMSYLFMKKEVKNRFVLALIVLDDIDKTSSLILYEFYSLKNGAPHQLHLEEDSEENVNFMNENQDINYQRYKLPIGNLELAIDGMPLHLIPLSSFYDSMVIVTEYQIMFLTTDHVVAANIHFPRLDLPKINNNDEVSLITCWSDPSVYKKTGKDNYIYLGSDKGYLYRLDINKNGNTQQQIELKLKLIGRIENKSFGNSLEIIERDWEFDVVAFSTDFSDSGVIWISNKGDTNNEDDYNYFNSYSFKVNNPYFDNNNDDEEENRNNKLKYKSNKFNLINYNNIKLLNYELLFFNRSPIIDFELINNKIVTCSNLYPNGSIYSLQYGNCIKLINLITSNTTISNNYSTNNIENIDEEEFYLDKATINSNMPSNTNKLLQPIRSMIYKIETIYIQQDSMIIIVMYNNEDKIQLYHLIKEELIDISSELSIDRSKATIYFNHFSHFEEQQYFLQILENEIVFYHLIQHDLFGARIIKFEVEGNSNVLFATTIQNQLFMIQCSYNGEYYLTCYTISLNNNEICLIKEGQILLNYQPCYLQCFKIEQKRMIFIANFSGEVLIYSLFNKEIELVTTIELKFLNPTEYIVANEIILYEKFILIGLKSGKVVIFEFNMEEEIEFIEFKKQVELGKLPVKFQYINQNTVLCISNQLYLLTINYNLLIDFKLVLNFNFNLNQLFDATIVNYNYFDNLNNNNSKAYLLAINDHPFDFNSNNKNNMNNIVTSPKLQPHHKQSPKNQSPKLFYNNSNNISNNNNKYSYLGYFKLQLKSEYLSNKLIIGGTPRRIHYNKQMELLLIMINEENKNYQIESYLRLIHPTNGNIYAQYKLNENEQGFSKLLWDSKFYLSKSKVWKYKAVYFIGTGILDGRNSQNNCGGRLLVVLIEIEFNYGSQVMEDDKIQLSTICNIKFTVINKMDLPMGIVCSLSKFKEHLILSSGKCIQFYLPNFNYNNQNQLFKLISLNIVCSHTIDSDVTNINHNHSDKIAVSTKQQSVYLFTFEENELKLIKNSKQLRNIGKFIFLNQRYGLAFDRVGNLILMETKTDNQKNNSISYKNYNTKLKEVNMFYFNEIVTNLKQLNDNDNTIAMGCTILGSLFHVQALSYRYHLQLIELQTILANSKFCQPLLGNGWYSLRYSQMDNDQIYFVDGYLIKRFLSLSYSQQVDLLNQHSEWEAAFINEFIQYLSQMMQS